MPGQSESPPGSACLTGPSGKPPPLALIDAIGPFFRDPRGGRKNWSKIAFSDVPWGPGSESFWSGVRADMECFADRAATAGFNAATLDSVAHLSPHPLHEPEVRARAEALAAEFHPLIEILRSRGLAVFFTSDYFPTTVAVDRAIGKTPSARQAHFLELLEIFFDRFPEVRGIILRVGECDGVDVRDPVRSVLAAQSAGSVNRLLRRLLPDFERSGRRLIFRTWAVGAGTAGDLIWHRNRLRQTLEGISSPALIVSMKPGESDFFRYLPPNGQFFRTDLPKIVEFQARREYEGAGEFPAFIGREVETLSSSLRSVPNIVGFSVWCQTGGWHRFRRRGFLGKDSLWIDLNSEVACAVFLRGESSDEFLARRFGEEHAADAREFFRLCDRVLDELYYIPGFARQKLFFRRVRIPPLIHIYWDRIFVVEPVREILRRYVADMPAALRQGREALALFPKIHELARRLGLPAGDLDFLESTCRVIGAAREYFFQPFDASMAERIRQAKAAYKAAWPRGSRPRYRVKISFTPTPLRTRLIGIALRLAFRRQRGYRVLLDRLVTLSALSWAYRVFAAGYRKRIPKFLRKSAMGVDAILR